MNQSSRCTGGDDCCVIVWVSVLVLFVSCVLMCVSQVLNFTLVARYFDRSGFIFFIGFGLVLLYS
jgi:threonine/homoserine/homoserine lactone efflux protein